jgi:hypothetical protein
MCVGRVVVGWGPVLCVAKLCIETVLPEDGPAGSKHVGDFYE